MIRILIAGFTTVWNKRIFVVALIWHWHSFNWLDCWCTAIANFCVPGPSHHHNYWILSTAITKMIHDSGVRQFSIFSAIWLQPHNLSVYLRNINRKLNRYCKNFLWLQWQVAMKKIFSPHLKVPIALPSLRIAMTECKRNETSAQPAAHSSIEN